MSESTPNAKKSARFGGIAQLVEQMTFNHWVQSSSLCASTRKNKSPFGDFIFFAQRRRTTEFDYEFVFANKVQRTQYECGTGIYAEPASVPPPEKLNDRKAVFIFVFLNFFLLYNLLHRTNHLSSKE